MSRRDRTPDIPGNQEDQETPDSASQTRNKRRRIGIACSACRTRKSRCDGQRPKCSLCAELGFECIYVQSASSSNIIVGKDYLSGLERRVDSIEGSLQDFQQTIERSLQAFERKLEQRLTILASQPHSVDTVGPVCREETDDDPGEIVVQDLADTNDPVDGMGAVVFADEEESGFFGPSSNIAFLRHISRAVAYASNVDQPWTPRAATDTVHIDGGFMNISRPFSPSPMHPHGQGRSEEQINLYALPPAAHVLDLIKRYFANTGYLFPYIHEETFVQTYLLIKDQVRPTVRRTWLGLLNMVLAMATTTTVDGTLNTSKRFRESDVYYRRARGLCYKQIMRGTSLETVQYLLLLGQYLQGTQKSIEAWTVHGLAVKAAFQLGLHSSEASKVFSPLDREIRKRTWFGCVVLDRSLSMTFGRPATIPDSYVKLDMPIEMDIAYSSSSSVEAGNSTNISFFAATVKLYKVLWHVIDLLYGQNIGCDKPLDVGETVSRLFKLELSLGEWERSLPSNLGITSSRSIMMQNGESPFGEETLIEHKLSTILTLRYLNLRILLHRPILVKFLDLHRGTGNDLHELKLLQQIGSNSIQICMQSSIQVISIVHAVSQAADWRRRLLGAWWFSLYYTFNAALVIFGCLLACQLNNGNPDIASVQISSTESREALAKAIIALRLLDRGNHMVDRCRHYLEQITYVLNSIIPGDPVPIPFPFPTDTQNPNNSNNIINNTTSYGLSNDSQFLEGGPAGFSFETALADDQSPLGMNLGEFMMDTDLQFLNAYFPKEGV